ncbi:MAG TPA: radical SAM protein, partial [Candidatus Methylomirabilis sp.]|nr:radical SAM protein [Candidatus Methylomirabilis sp.]
FTRKCNLRCTYCYASAGEALDQELSFEELIGVAEQAKNLGARRIVLLGGGEPLLFPKLREIIRHLHSLDLTQVVFTNGMLLTEELCRFLYTYRVAVAVKQNSLSPCVQDGLAGVKGASGRIRRGLRLLMEAGYPDADRPLCIQTVICRPNQRELPAMWIWARERGITPYFEVLTEQGRARQNRHLALSPEEIRPIFETLSQIDRDRYGIRWIPRPPIAGFTCRRHLYSCLVNSQGFVQPCTGVDVSVGNVRRQPLGTILRESRVIRDLRRVHREIAPRCRACGYAGECYGCRGNAYQITGDYLAADPTCWLERTTGAAAPTSLRA